MRSRCDPGAIRVRCARFVHQERVDREYKTLNQVSATLADGTTLHLYSKLLALLLRVSSLRGADAAEIARRTHEVLDQFERNADQQAFLLRIWETLERRTRLEPELFASINLTLLSEVCQNGVQTLASVSGEGMELCERAMTTLLEGYVTNEKPMDWKELFKEATNVGFMVKYMFRESLPLAKKAFAGSAKDKSLFKKMPKGDELQEMMISLVEDTHDAYGTVGIFDPEKVRCPPRFAPRFAPRRAPSGARASLRASRRARRCCCDLSSPRSTSSTSPSSSSTSSPRPNRASRAAPSRTCS